MYGTKNQRAFWAKLMAEGLYEPNPARRNTKAATKALTATRGARKKRGLEKNRMIAARNSEAIMEGKGKVRVPDYGKKKQEALKTMQKSNKMTELSKMAHAAKKAKKAKAASPKAQSGAKKRVVAKPKTTTPKAQSGAKRRTTRKRSTAKK